MKSKNRIGSPKSSQQLTSEPIATVRQTSFTAQYLELKEEELTYSPQVAQYCVC